MNTISLIFQYMGGMLAHPARTGKALAAEKSLKPAAVFVIAFGILQSLMFLISYLAHDYPPPPEVLAVWAEHWGKGVMPAVLQYPCGKLSRISGGHHAPLCTCDLDVDGRHGAVDRLAV